jgi:hypothetical protein
MGEVVLFTRNAPEDGHASWEAGIITQTPVEESPISDEDLTGIPPHKKHNVTFSGFRVEPLPEPNNEQKPYTSQHKYVPLHAIRPFALWKDCLRGAADTHPTLRHAMTVASSFCTVGPIKFKGTWPAATTYMRGVFVGPELIVLGDIVRIAPRASEDQQVITDIMVVSSIRLRFVNLDEANDDDYDDDLPYNTCLHILGKAYSLNPDKGYLGAATPPALPRADLAAYGTWYPTVDPNDPKPKLEIPYARVLGKCFEKPALKAWLSSPAKTTATAFQAVNTRPTSPYKPDLSYGLAAIREARQYSTEHDSRIDRAGDKAWFWAESRIEQLDLHELNGRFVGEKDLTRDKHQMRAWRQALKVLDGKKGGSEALAQAMREREEVQHTQSQSVGDKFGMLGGSQLQGDNSATEGEASGVMDGGMDIIEVEDDANEKAAAGDAMDVDVAVPPPVSQSQPTPKQGMLSIPKPIDLSNDEDDDEDELMTGWGIRGT